MSRRNLSLAAASVAFAVAPLFACSAEPEAGEVPAPARTVQPRPTQTSTSTAVPTPTTTVEPPPSFAFTLSEDDAGNFAGYAIQVLNYTRETNESAAWRAIVDPACEGCSKIADVTDEFAEAGAFYQNPDIQEHELRIEHFDPVSAEAEVLVTASVDFGVVIRSDGTLDGEPDPIDHGSFTFFQRYTVTGWKLVGLE
ncbi:MAG: DUF6318 family protein [Janthinobacterium lividum]